MEVFEAVRTVLAVRKYQDKPIPLDVVRRIVEAGRLTGSSMNGQPWHFIVVQDRDTLRQLGALAKNRTLYRTSARGDCRRHSADDIFSIRCQPCDSIDD